MPSEKTLDWPILASLMVLLVLAALDQTVASTALPLIAKDLEGHGLLGWIFSIYLVASTAVIPLYGRLADRYGRRRVLLVAAALFVTGSAACGASRGIEQLLVARGLQGLGGGGLMTLAMLAARDVAPPRRVGQIQGTLGSIYGLAALFGPLLGGWLAQSFSWRWAFLLNVPIGLLVLVVLFSRYRPRVEAVPGAIDPAGACLFALLLAALLVATREMAAMGHGESAPTGLIAPALAMVAGLLFAWRETTVARPLLPLHLFRQCIFVLSSLLSAGTGLSLFSALVFAPLYLQYAMDMTAVQSGLHMLPLMAVISGGSIVGGRWLASRGRLRSVAIVAAGSMAAGLAGAAIGVGAASVRGLLGALCAVGLGIGLAIPLSMMAAQRAAVPQDLGIATALPLMFRNAGGALGVSFLGALLAHQLQLAPGGTASAEALAAAFSAATGAVFWAAAVPCALVCLAMSGMPRMLPAPRILISTK
ncbi:MFS transporter [Variovorax paradoxus]|uniref:MFS transporter n=1 Tax=Variovorax paradoxus TaxID=34073 RepID=UPI001ABD0E47